MADKKAPDIKSLIDYMARDYDSILQSMLDQVPEKLPEWTGADSPADFGRAMLELFAHMGDILSYYQDRVAAESFLATASSRRSVIQHLELIGYRLATAMPASARLTLTAPATASAAVTLRKSDAFATKGSKDQPSVRFEYTREEDLVVDFSALAPDPITGRKIAVEAVPVEEGRLIVSELAGVSDGTARQAFVLAQPGLILRPVGPGLPNTDLLVRTELGAAPNLVSEPWALQESLAFSREGQLDFTVSVDEQDRATLRFGDNAFGAIPPAGSRILATYRVGGGVKGNVAPGSIRTVLEAPALSLLGVQAFNPRAATGGADRESIEHAAFLAPSVFRSQKRAVTVQDYEALALQFKGVGKVRAQARHWNRVDLYVAPEGGGHVSDTLASRLLDYFEDKRPMSVRIEIRDVDYAPIYVSATIGIRSYYSQAEMRSVIEAAARALLAFDAVDFGQTVYLSKFYEAIEAIEGVDYVTVDEFRGADAAPMTVEPSGKLLHGSNEIPMVPDRAPEDNGYLAGLRLTLAGGY